VSGWYLPGRPFDRPIVVCDNVSPVIICSIVCGHYFDLINSRLAPPTTNVSMKPT
jgi:hypothetical protein